MKFAKSKLNTNKHSTFYNNQMVSDLSYILNNVFCYRNIYKAVKRYNEIRDALVLQDKQAIYSSLMNLYGNPDTCFDQNNRLSYFQDFAEDIKTIQNRKSVNEKLVVHIISSYTLWTDNYEFNINENFVNGTFNALVQKEYEKTIKKWNNFIKENNI